MRAVVQVVSHAKVVVEDKIISQIKDGLLIYLGIQSQDTQEDIKKFAEKTSKLRVFADQNKKLNLSAKDLNYPVLVVSQFTLCASFKGTNRPDFGDAQRPEHAIKLYETYCDQLRQHGLEVQTGAFGEWMMVDSVNNGPNTFIF